jgi:F-type H+-transporting ATPase subunit delta
VARRYARALIDLAARDQHVAEIGAQLRQHLDLIRTHTDLQRILYNPGVNADLKRDVLRGILERTQPLPLLRNFLLLLADKDRLSQFEGIYEVYERLANERMRRVVAHVTTAVALDAAQRQAMTQKLTQMTQKEVLLETHVDPAILGGVVVRINHTVLDGSLQGKLARLRQELVGG